MATPLAVLIVEDSADDAELVSRFLAREGFEPIATRVETAEAMRQALDTGSWDLVIADHNMPRFSSSGALEVLRAGLGMLDGMLELAEETLGMPVRQGLPLGVRGLTEELSHPVYATSVGLALFGAEEAGYRKKNPGKSNGSSGLFGKILSWAGS